MNSDRKIIIKGEWEMSKKLKKIIRNTVLISLLTVIGFTGLKLGNIKRPAESNVKIEQVMAEKEIENLQEKQQLLIKTFQECCKLQIASGTIDMNYNFTNTVPEISDSSKVGPFRILKDTLTHRNFNYNSQYQYNFKYDLSKINTSIDDGTLNINIDSSFLLLEDVKENKEHTTITQDTGIIAKNLNANETWAMSKLCELKAYNYLITDLDLQENAMNGLEKGIKTMVDNLGIKNYKINILKNRTLTNKDNYTDIHNICQNSSLTIGE